MLMMLPFAGTLCADESGQRLFGSCLSFFDAVPGPLALRHEQLLGGQASKVLCLLSRQPYLASMEQASRRAAFFGGGAGRGGDVNGSEKKRKTRWMQHG